MTRRLYERLVDALKSLGDTIAAAWLALVCPPDDELVDLLELLDAGITRCVGLVWGVPERRTQP